MADETPAEKPQGKKAPKNVLIEQFLQAREKEGPVPDKVKEVFRARCATSTDYQAVWDGLWR